MAGLAILAIVLSYLSISTSTDSAGSAIDPLATLLTDQNIATSISANQLAILSILSDSSTQEQELLHQYKNETLHAANATLEARINQYEIKLVRTGQAVLQQCRNETQAASETMEARINQYENQLNQIEQAVLQQCKYETQAVREALQAQINQNEIQHNQARQEVLQQCRKETQAASETLEVRINQYENQLNQTGQAVVQQGNEIQAAIEALEARINQIEIQLNQAVSEALEVRINQIENQLDQNIQAVLQQCRKETQTASEMLEVRINQYKTQLNQTGQAVVQQWNDNQAASEALEARIKQTEIQLRQQVEQQWIETQALNETLDAHINQNVIQFNQTRKEMVQLWNETQGVREALQAQINQNEIQHDQVQYTRNDIETSSCSGNKVVYGSSGLLELSSSMYTNSKDCSWEVVAPEGSVLDIQWLGFQLENHTNCNFDWVKIVDSYRPNELIYGQKLCGSPGFLNTSSYMTSTNKLKVTFHSDGSNTYNGFKLWFQALQIPHSSHNTLNNVGTSSCSGTKELLGTTGTLELPTSQYTHHKDCQWTVHAPEGSVLALQWLMFHTEINHDWVKIVDLHRPTELVYGTGLNGTRGFFNTSSWMVSSNAIKVSFHSDHSVIKDGFKLRFQALQIPYSSQYQTRQVIHNDTVPSTCSGNKVLEGTWGQLVLTSYTHNKDCSWVLKTPPGSVVSLRWLRFSLEPHSACNYDWVKVTDLNRPSPLVYGKKLCGTSEFLMERALTVPSDRIHIAFHSDGSGVGTGFLLEYQAIQVPTTNRGH